MRCRLFAYGPADATASPNPIILCLISIQTGCTFLVPTYPGCPGKAAVKRAQCSGVAHLVDHGTTGSTSYETIPTVRLESSGGVLSTVDMVVQRRDGPRRLRDHDDDDECSSSSSSGNWQVGVY